MIARKPQKPPEAARQALAYGYARVSTDKQAQFSLSLDGQDDAIREYHRRHVAPFDVPLVEIAVEAISASKTPFAKRDHGLRLMELLKPGDHLIITRIDRGFRDLADCSQTLKDMVKRGVNVHIIRGGLVLKPGDKFQQAVNMQIVHVMGLCAEFESAMLSARVSESHARRRAMGLYVSSVPRPGFKIAGPKGRKRLVPNEEERAIMRYFVELNDAGMGTSEIETFLAKKRLMRVVRDRGEPTGKRLEFWGRDTIRRCIKAIKEIDAQEAEAARLAAAGNSHASQGLAEPAGDGVSADAEADGQGAD